MSQMVLEGPWEEILNRSDELSGKRVRLSVLDDEESRLPNDAMLTALREIAVIQAGMRFTLGQDSGQLLRDAREGGMYGPG
jgi:hypothetical protein